MSDKSIKLNRDLDKMLAQAIERDLLVRIGWGREGCRKSHWILHERRFDSRSWLSG